RMVPRVHVNKGMRRGHLLASNPSIDTLADQRHPMNGDQEPPAGAPPHPKPVAAHTPPFPSFSTAVQAQATLAAISIALHGN
ncbi:hypothetical protein MCOR31_010994, partial [Pyricularia oryzae]